jgi:hypothetical protein
MSLDSRYNALLISLADRDERFENSSRNGFPQARQKIELGIFYAPISNNIKTRTFKCNGYTLLRGPIRLCRKCLILRSLGY